MRVLAVCIVTGVTLSACSTQVNFYPVEGPLAAQKPLPSIVATADGITGNTGNIDLTLPGGERCAGKWSSVAPQFAAVSSGSLFSRYGQTAGFAVTTGPVPGVNKGQAFLSCNQGTTIEAEFFTGSGTANGYGVARDSKANVYKLIF
jgi:hypothetical protein